MEKMKILFNNGVTFEYNAPFTGGWRSALPSVRRSIAALARGDRCVTGCYIGIASGSDAFPALFRRVDAYKIQCGISRVVCLYETSSRNFTVQMERDLEKIFREYWREGLLLNRTGGGGGRPDTQPFRYLYTALRYGTS